MTSEIWPELARRFVHRDRLDSGSQATLFLAFDRRERREGVLKLYHPSPQSILSGRVAEVLDRWRERSGGDERRIVALYDFDEMRRPTRQGGNNYYLWEFQEYVDGGNLRTLLDTAPWGEQAVVDLVTQVSGILQLVHGEMEIVHKDIKPENILLRQSPDTGGQLELAISDLGIARVMAGTWQHGTSPAFDPLYGAPEVYHEDYIEGYAGDLWSVGIIAAEAILGDHPYDTQRPAALSNRIRERPVDVSHIPNERLALLARGLLHRDHEQRWTRTDLGEWLSGQSPDVAADTGLLGLDGPSIVVAAGFTFRSDTYHSPTRLFDAMQREWREATTLYLDPEAAEAGRLLEWFSEDLQDPVAVDVLTSDASADRKLARLAARYCPRPPRFRWEADDPRTLTRAEIGDVAQRVAAESPSDDSDGLYDWLALLHAEGILYVWAGAAEADPGLADLADSLAKAARQLPDEVDERLALASIVLAIIDPEFRADIRRQAAEVASDDLARSDPWFRELADRTLDDPDRIGQDVALTLAVGSSRERALEQDAATARRHTTFRRALRRIGSTIGLSMNPGEYPLIQHFDAQPATAPVGVSLRVTWSVVNADRVELIGHGEVPPSGSIELLPRGSGSIQLNAYSPGGRQRQRTSAYRRDHRPLIREFRVEPAAVLRGDPVTISWEVEGVDTVDIHGVGRLAAAGTTTDYPQFPTAYRLSAANTAERVSASSQLVHVVKEPPFETRPLAVPVADLPFEVPVAALPDLRGVFRPELIDLVVGADQIPSMTLGEGSVVELPTLPMPPSPPLPSPLPRFRMLRSPFPRQCLPYPPPAPKE